MERAFELGRRLVRTGLQGQKDASFNLKPIGFFAPGSAAMAMGERYVSM